MRTWTDAHDPRPSRNVGLGLGLLAIAILLLVAIFALAGKAGANAVPNTNEVAYWCPNGGVKYDNLTSTLFTVPAPPDGHTWSLLVLKAGSDQSVENENETFPNPVVGQSYSHSSGKTLSHAILCYGEPVTTTTGATTTGASTTLATTTTAASTTLPSTTQFSVPTTICDEDECVTTTTSPSTTIATTTTVPRTTTTAPTTTGPPCDVAHSCISIPVTTASTIATTTTVAPPTTIPDTTAVDQTLPPAPAAPVTPAPTTLPVTGGSPWWLALFGVCLVGLGGLLLAWRRS